jgi:hypothetical protein
MLPVARQRPPNFQEDLRGQILSVLPVVKVGIEKAEYRPCVAFVQTAKRISITSLGCYQEADVFIVRHGRHRG